MKLAYKATERSCKKKRGEKVSLISKANFHTRKLYFPPMPQKAIFNVYERALFCCPERLAGWQKELLWASK